MLGITDTPSYREQEASKEERSKMLSSLKARQKDLDGRHQTETKSGVYIFSGHPADFYEWEFRTMARYNSCKDEDKPALGGKILEGLKGDAYMVVQDLGLEALAKPDAVPTLVSAMRKNIFPLLKDEAKELFLVGQRPDGILSRQVGEPMMQYIARRKRWWRKVQELDGQTYVSESVLADLLLDNARLSKTERLMIQTSCNNVASFQGYADAMTTQHARIHLDERAGSRTYRPKKGGGKGGGKIRRSAHVAHVYSEDDGTEWVVEEAAYIGDTEYEIEEHDPEASTVHDGDEDDDMHAMLATGDIASTNNEVLEQKESIELDVMTAFLGIAESESTTTESQCELIADAAQAENNAYYARTRAKGKGFRMSKGKGKGKHVYRPRASMISLEDRRRKLKEIKLKSTCKRCGKKGHWAGDPECKKPKSALIAIRQMRTEDHRRSIGLRCTDCCARLDPVPLTCERGCNDTRPDVYDCPPPPAPFEIVDMESDVDEMTTAAQVATRGFAVYDSDDGCEDLFPCQDGTQ